jgi:hypothetical protein
MSDLLDDRSTASPAFIAPDETVESLRRLAPISCVYCWEPIPAESFAYWSPAKRVLSVSCPCCDRRVILSAATWRRLSGLAREHRE